ncbi:MAG: Cytochrome c biogenesis ATP-binding export protein CcmA [Holosporales bacterium]
MMIHVQNLTDPHIGTHRSTPLSFQVKAGEMLMIQGRNGSGKTTLLKRITGIKKAASGSIDIHAPYSYLPFQNPLFPELKIKDYLQKDSAFFDFWERNDSYQAIKNDYIGNLSQGQLRQLAIFLSIPYPIWIMDEPTTALDTKKRQILLQRFDEHIKKSGAILFTSHDGLAPHAHILKI